CCNRLAICGQASSQRSLQATLRKAAIGLTFPLAQCIPACFIRAWMTTLLALSTRPLPIGYPSRRIVGNRSSRAAYSGIATSLQSIPGWSVLAVLCGAVPTGLLLPLRGAVDDVACRTDA